MNSLKIKYRITILCSLCFFMMGCTAKASEKPDKSCVAQILSADVVREDDVNHRFFIVSKKITALDIKKNLSLLEKCFETTQWQPDWALSIFSEARYAGYKDETHILPYHKDNMWANAYLFEYDHASKTLTSKPAVKPESVRF